MKIYLLILIILLSGCGTVNTVLRDDYIAVKKLKTVKTYCPSIPRIYSGLSYDVCSLYAKPNHIHGEGSNDFGTVPFIFLDSFFSTVLDTIVLPYTLYRHNEDGNIEIYD